MQPTPYHCALLWLFALLVSVGLTQVTILTARKYNLIAKPKSDRWHQTPTALYGGVAIVMTFLLASACVLARYTPPRSLGSDFEFAIFCPRTCSTRRLVF